MDDLGVWRGVSPVDHARSNSAIRVEAAVWRFPLGCLWKIVTATIWLPKQHDQTQRYCRAP